MSGGAASQLAEESGREDAELDIGAIYERHREAMFRTACKVLRGYDRASDAMDVVHEVVMEVMRKRPNDVVNWESYLVNLTKWRATDYVKSARSRHETDLLDENWEPPAHEADVAHIAIDRQRAAVALDSLRNLDERRLQVIREIVVRGRPRAVVASEMGISTARISQLLGTGIASVLSDLDDWEAGAND